VNVAQGAVSPQINVMGTTVLNDALYRHIVNLEIATSGGSASAHAMSDVARFESWKVPSAPQSKF
jgi:hypothetical protein